MTRQGTVAITRSPITMENKGQENMNSFILMLLPAKHFRVKNLWVSLSFSRVPNSLLDMKLRHEFVQENHQSKAYNAIFNDRMKKEMK